MCFDYDHKVYAVINANVGLGKKALQHCQLCDQGAV